MHVKRPTGTQVQDGEGKMIVVAVGENTYQESLLAEKPKDGDEEEEGTHAHAHALAVTLSLTRLLRVLPCSSPICPQKVQAIFQSTHNNLFDTIGVRLSARRFCVLILRCCVLYLFFLMHHPLACVRLAIFSHVSARLLERALSSPASLFVYFRFLLYAQRKRPRSVRSCRRSSTT
jgi:magnesium-transporting ATPase (P-type)